MLGSHSALSRARYHDTDSAGMGTLIMDIAGNTAESTTTSNFVESRAEDLSVTRAEKRGVEHRGQKRGRQARPAALPSAAEWQNLIADMGTVHLRDSVRQPQVSGCCLLGSVGVGKTNNGPKNMCWVVLAVGRNNAGAQSPTRPPPTCNNLVPCALDQDTAPTFFVNAVSPRYDVQRVHCSSDQTLLDRRESPHGMPDQTHQDASPPVHGSNYSDALGQGPSLRGGRPPSEEDENGLALGPPPLLPPRLKRAKGCSYSNPNTTIGGGVRTFSEGITPPRQ